MPTCRHCFGTYHRNQFIHGNGPRAQVCVRCGVEKGLVSAEEAPTLYDGATANARFTAVARRWAPAMWLMIIWTVWTIFLTYVEPWGLYVLILLILFTLALPLYMFFFSSRHMAVMARLTPAYDRPPGH